MNEEFDRNEEVVSRDILLEKFWADPRFQFLIETIKVLESSRIWGGMEWVYNPVHSYKYLPLLEKARGEMKKLKSEYGIGEM